MGSIQVPDEVVALLNDIWQHLGLSNGQRDQALQGLKASLSDFVLKFVENEQHRVEDAKQDIANTRQRILSMSKALGSVNHVEIDTQAPLLEQLHTLEKLEASIQHRKSAAAAVMSKKLGDLQAVYRQLAMEVPEEFAEVGDTDLTDSRLSYIDAALDQAYQERNARQAMMTKLLSTANLIAKQLEISSLKIDGITPDDQRDAEKKLGEFQILMSEKSEKLIEVRRLVEKRWIDLKKNGEHISSFNNCLTGVIASDLRSFEGELERLNREYAAALPHLLEACRGRIQSLRSELRYENVEVDFGELNESMEKELQALEKEESLLKRQLEELRPILLQIVKWEKLRQELLEGLEESSAYSNDPNRFHGRQAFKMLKKEEDLRRLESKTLPRMQEKLQSMIQCYERDQGGRPFLVDGKPFLLTLKELSVTGKENYLRTPDASPAVLRTPNAASQTPGLMRRASLNSTSKKASATPDSAPRPRRLRISSGISESGRDSSSMFDRLTKVLEQADLALKNSKNCSSEEILSSLTQAIEDLNCADPAIKTKHADALSDLYHKRAVIYTHLGDYDASIRDSEAAQLALSGGRNAIN